MSGFDQLRPPAPAGARPLVVTGQACPECGPLGHNQWCPWCFGTNVVSDDVWSQWVIAQGGRQG